MRRLSLYSPLPYLPSPARPTVGYCPGNRAQADCPCLRGYLGRRSAADWGFFAAGVVLGALFF